MKLSELSIADLEMLGNRLVERYATDINKVPKDIQRKIAAIELEIMRRIDKIDFNS